MLAGICCPKKFMILSVLMDKVEGYAVGPIEDVIV
jgi:hypothetical protein